MKQVLFILFTLTSIFTIGQQQASSNIDSLVQIIESTPDDGIRARTLVLLSDEYSAINLDTIPVLCKKALDIVNSSPLQNNDIEKLNLRFAEAEALNNLGFYHVMKGNLDSAYHFLSKAKIIATETRNLECVQSVGINISVVLGEQGKHKESIKVLEQNLQLAMYLKDEQGQATILNNIGWIYQVLRQFDRALIYYRNAYEIHSKLGDDVRTSSALNNIGVAYSGLEKQDSALHYYQKAFEIRKTTEDTRGLSNSYSNLGGTYLKLGDSIKAKEYYLKGLEICRKNDFKRLWISALNALGKLAIAQKDMSLAMSCSTEIDSLLPYYNTPVSQLMYHQILHQISASNGDWKTAYQSLLEYKMVQDSANIKTIGNELIAKELELEAEKEKEIIAAQYESNQLLSKEKETRLQNNLYFTLGLCLVLAVALFYLFKFFSQRQKLSSVQLELTKLKNDKLKVEMGQKNKELTTFSLRVAQNNQFLENVDEIITQVNSSSKEEIENNLRELKNEIKTTKRRDKDWSEFQRQFEGIHTEFIENLTQLYPSLTANEIRLCTLIKLNLPSKDICSVLGISSNTLKSSRYRIHKKMELTTGEKLAEYILKLN